MPLWLLAIILGFVEGLTEFLPVSSTGHLLIAEHLLKLDPGSFLRSDLFNVVIQAGAVMAVIPLFRERLAMLSRWQEPVSQRFIAKIVAACLITGIPGFILEKKHFKLPEEVQPVALALVIGGVVFIAVEAWLRGKSLSEEISWPVVVAVGVGQLIAMVFPGSSRSGSTIILAMVVGATRPRATEFSFLVGIPTMLAATVLKIFHAMHHPAADALPTDWSTLILASVVAIVVSFITVKWLLRYVQSHTFIGFGIYRIVVGILLLLFLR